MASISLVPRRIPPPERGRTTYRAVRERRLRARIETSAVMRDRRRHAYKVLVGKQTNEPPRGRVLWEGMVRDQDEADQMLLYRVMGRATRVQRHRAKAGRLEDESSADATKASDTSAR